MGADRRCGHGYRRYLAWRIFPLPRHHPLDQDPVWPGRQEVKYDQHNSNEFNQVVGCPLCAPLHYRRFAPIPNP